MKLLSLLAGAALGLAGSFGTGGQAVGQEYPSQPITLIVPFGAGGSTDTASRVAANFLSEKWGVPVVVVNKPGGNTIIATLELYGAEPNGYTVFAETIGTTAMPLAVDDIPVDLLNRTFLAGLAAVPNLLVVNADSPHRSFEELAQVVKADPGSFVWSSQGGASSADIAMRQLARSIDLDLSKTRPIVSPSAAEMLTMVAGGHTQASFSTVAASKPLLDAGSIRGLAVTNNERSSAVPDVPSFGELGLPGVSVVNWFGFTGPAGMPADVIARWDEAVQDMLKDEKVLQQLSNVGFGPWYMESSEFKAFVDSELKEFEELK